MERDEVAASSFFVYRVKSRSAIVVASIRLHHPNRVERSSLEQPQPAPPFAVLPAQSRSRSLTSAAPPTLTNSTGERFVPLHRRENGRILNSI